MNKIYLYFVICFVYAIQIAYSQLAQPQESKKGPKVTDVVSIQYYF